MKTNLKFGMAALLAVSLLLLTIIACAEKPTSPTPAGTEAAVGVQPAPELTSPEIKETASPSTNAYPPREKSPNTGVES